jgi:enterochelin esterase-like enzyme
MKKAVLIVVLSLCWVCVRTQPFGEFLTYVNGLPAASRHAKADSFLLANPRLPYTDHDTVCYFIYKGGATTVSVAGDPTGWKPGKINMQKITGTDLWYATWFTYKDTRIDYKIVVDTSQWILDPGNPYTVKSGFGVNSELRMPGYIPPRETFYDPAVPHGTVIDTMLTSKIMGDSRAVKIYLPAGYNAGGKRYPVVLFHDGFEYITLGGACIVLDNLIAEKRIRPVIGIFLPPVDREPEYSGDRKDRFTTFIVSELMPAIDRNYRTSSDPHDRATVGISNGGNIALYLGMKHPESFGKVAAYSSNIIPLISRTFSKGEKLDLEIYLDIGKYDIDILIPMAEEFAAILKERGYVYHYYTWNDGHSWANWRDHLAISFGQFFPSEKE